MSTIQFHTKRRHLYYAAACTVLSMVLTFVSTDAAQVTIGYGDRAMISDWYAPAAWAFFALASLAAAGTFVAAHFDRRYQ